ncbi:MAG TPA: hypothetical protein VFX48_00565 [Saprospiraceae bacterium]|nr:hypothetical protein [Saprospiraceae bacterium]
MTEPTTNTTNWLYTAGWLILGLCLGAFLTRLYMSNELDQCQQDLENAKPNVENCCALPEFKKYCELIKDTTGFVGNLGFFSRVRGYYLNYFKVEPTPKDTFGFSIDRELVLKLLALMVNDPTGGIKGFRLYPGLNEDQKMTLIIALIQKNSTDEYLSEDSEKVDSFLKTDIALAGYQGPCPTWCENKGRALYTGNELPIE